MFVAKDIYIINCIHNMQLKKKSKSTYTKERDICT